MIKRKRKIKTKIKRREKAIAKGIQQRTIWTNRVAGIDSMEE